MTFWQIFETLKSRNSDTKSQETLKPRSQRTLKLREQETKKLRNQKTKKPRHQKPKDQETENQEAKKPRNLKPFYFQVREPQQPSTYRLPHLHPTEVVP